MRAYDSWKDYHSHRELSTAANPINSKYFSTDFVSLSRPLGGRRPGRFLIKERTVWQRALRHIFHLDIALSTVSLSMADSRCISPVSARRFWGLLSRTRG